MIITTARFTGGPFDGKVDQGVLIDKLPELATWAYCHECKRSHLHSVELGEDRDPDVPVYLRDGDESSQVLVLYRWQDVDEELDELLEQAQLSTAASSANMAPIGSSSTEYFAGELPQHPNCRCSFEPPDWLFECAPDVLPDWL